MKEIRGDAVALAATDRAVLVLETRRGVVVGLEAAGLQPQLQLRARVLADPGLGELRIRFEVSAKSLSYAYR